MNTLAEHKAVIIDRFCRIYHKERSEGRHDLEHSEFYRVLSAKDSPLLIQTPGENFMLFQNEIEYGCWHAGGCDHDDAG